MILPNLPWQGEFNMREGRVDDPDIAQSMAIEEDKGRATGRVGKFIEKTFGTKKLKEAQEKSELVGEQLEKQKALVNEFYSSLQEAGRSNKVYNILQGEPNKELGPIEAYKINNDTSVIVSFSDPSSMQRRGDLIQISVDLSNTGQEIHLFQAPYGPDKDFSLEQKDAALREVTDYVKNYRLYPGSDRKE